MIPLSTPNIGPREKELVLQAMDSGWVSTAGLDVRAFEDALEEYCGARFAVATNSGTAALHLALKVGGVSSGDLVLAPNLTFVASINPVYYLEAEVILVDVNSDTWQMDLDLVEEFLENETEKRSGQRVHRASGKRISGLLAVHILGYPCDIYRMMALGEQYGIPVIEDAAEGMGSMLNGQHLGTFGKIGALSFNGNKIMTTGGGGAVLTDDPAEAEYARTLASQARRHYQEYLHDEVGYNYKMTNLAAAVGLAQLERLEEFIDRKTKIWKYYQEAFAGMDIEFIAYPDEVRPNHWLITVQHPNVRRLESALEANDIQSRKLWIPMNRLPPFSDCLYLSQVDNSHHIYEHSLSLPCSTGIRDEELETVCLAVKNFLHHT